MKKTIGLIIVALFFTVCIVSCATAEPLTEEEKAQLEQERLARIHTYEVVSVYKYVRQQTNNFGGVTSTDICYNFQWIDGNGNLQTEDMINLNGGLTHVCLGESDVYVVDGNNNHRYLYLCKDTWNKLTN